eukprot:tig00000624_g2645.t1
MAGYDLSHFVPYALVGDLSHFVPYALQRRDLARGDLRRVLDSSWNTSQRYYQQGDAFRDMRSDLRRALQNEYGSAGRAAYADLQRFYGRRR